MHISRSARLLLACLAVGGFACTSTQPGTTNAGSSGPGLVAAATSAKPAKRLTPQYHVTGSAPCRWFDLPLLDPNGRKVFAHYFPPYPLSIDNKPPAGDYYAVNYTQPSGEGGKFADVGGLLTDRPETPARQPGDWQVEDLRTEVRRAIDAGLSGFTFDVLDVTPGSPLRERLDQMLVAAASVDPTFEIQLVFDMTGGAFSGSEATARSAMVGLIDQVASSSALQRTDDGRIVVSAFGSDARSNAFWQSVRDAVKADGHDIALVAMPTGLVDTTDLSGPDAPWYGVSSWGTRAVGSIDALDSGLNGARAKHLVWMAPVTPQDARPRKLIYWETDNSAAYRAEWERIIGTDADWVQVITWNDYSENTQVAPSARTGRAFYDLTAYYAAWFRSRQQPAVTRDQLLYFYRANSMNPALAPPDLTRQAQLYTVMQGGVPHDVIELVAFLTAPGTLQIKIGGQTYQQAVGAGLQTLAVPLEQGTPVFSLLRGSTSVAQVAGVTPINNKIVYQNPEYQAGESTPTGC